MKFLVITNCTSRKRASGIVTTSNDPFKFNSLTGLANAWVKRLSEARDRTTVIDLYQGRAFSESRHAARLLGAGVHVISAGLGLVDEMATVPPYSLTTSPGEGSIKKWLEVQNASSSDWWTALTEELGTPRPLSALVNASAPTTTVLIALPASYLGMVMRDLVHVDPDSAGRLRIFTSDAGARMLPVHLKAVAMPYDDRLEGLPTHAGTRTEFPHRALRHFVEKLNAHRLPLQEAKDAVVSSLEGAQIRITPKRAKATDATVGQLVRANWAAHGGSSGRLLRFLRDDAMVACEQSRFRSIWTEIHAEMKSAGVTA